MKNRILTIVLSLVTYTLFAQNKLINSVTLTVDSTKSTVKTTKEILWYHGYNVKEVAHKDQIPIDLSQWHYVVYTKTSNNIGKLYIDGQLKSTDTIQNLGFNWYSFYIGSTYYTSFTNFYNGLIDDIRISNIVRSDSEILSVYNSNIANTIDNNTIALWQFNESSGNQVNNSVTNVKGNLFGGHSFTNGKFGNAISFDGVNGFGDLNFNLPENNMTIEFWFKKNGELKSDVIMELYGMYNMYIGLDTTTYTTVSSKDIEWSNGTKGYKTTINPDTISKIWVTDGIDTDTINLNGLCITKVSVTDTLKISHITGLNTLPSNFGLVKVYPNPAKDVLNISVSNPSANYSIQITNQLGQVLYTNSLSNSSLQVNVNSLGVSGLCFIKILDLSNNVLDTRKLVLE